MLCRYVAGAVVRTQVATELMSLTQLLEQNTPGKIGGAPGNAFELVYASTTEPVRRRMHSTDPTLCEWIRQALHHHLGAG